MIEDERRQRKRIVEQEQAGKERAKYGQALIEALADCEHMCSQSKLVAF